MRQLTGAERLASYLGIAAGLPGFTLRPFAPRAVVRRYQLGRLQRLVAHAYAHVPFYRDRYRRAGVAPGDLRTLADLARFPTVSKRDLLEAGLEACLTRGLDRGRLLVSKSSGSTGEVLAVAHRADRLAVQGLALHRLLSMAGPYGPRDRFAYVYTSEYPARGALGLYPMAWIHTLSPVDVIAERLERFRPTFLACYPSHLRAIADALGPARARALVLRAISVSSEPSTDAERLALGARFGCPVLDEYSTEELTRISAQCRARTHHLFEDVVVAEVLGRDADVEVAPGEAGELVGTYLHNFAMPFIRYRQGDVVRVDEATRCRCGRTTRTLRSIEGRRLDAFLLPSGRRLTSGWLLDATYAFLLDLEADLAAFRMTQERRDRVRIEIVAGPGFRLTSREDIRRRFGELVGEPLDVVVDVVPAIEPSAAGKHHPIRSLVTFDEAGGALGSTREGSLDDG